MNKDIAREYVCPMHCEGDKRYSKYFCPMRCEGDKTYDKPGVCPVCGMHLNKEESALYSKTIYTCPMHPEVKSDPKPSIPVPCIPRLRVIKRDSAPNVG